MSRPPIDPTLRGGYTDCWAQGDLVETMFDTGALGATTLWGEILHVGPRTFTIEWESGLRNRLRHGEPKGVKLVMREEEREHARRAMTVGRRIARRIRMLEPGLQVTVYESAYHGRRVEGQAELVRFVADGIAKSATELIECWEVQFVGQPGTCQRELLVRLEPITCHSPPCPPVPGWQSVPARG